LIGNRGNHFVGESLSSTRCQMGFAPLPMGRPQCGPNANYLINPMEFTPLLLGFPPDPRASIFHPSTDLRGVPLIGYELAFVSCNPNSPVAIQPFIVAGRSSVRRTIRFRTDPRVQRETDNSTHPGNCPGPIIRVAAWCPTGNQGLKPLVSCGRQLVQLDYLTIVSGGKALKDS